MQLEDRIRHLFESNIEAKITLADTMSALISKAAQRLVTCLLNDGKIFICGQGGSAANALHFSSAMLNHFEVERPPLPVIALVTDVAMLTAATSDGQADHAFARQIQALGHENDVLIVLTTTGQSNAMLHAIDAAKERGMDSIVLNGRDGGVLANHLGPEDIELLIPNDFAARIREIHLFLLHCFCDLIDQALFGQEM